MLFRMETMVLWFHKQVVDLVGRLILNLIELPDDLNVSGYLYLKGCNSLKKLPNNLEIKGYIWINSNQEELINFIKQSEYKEQLCIEEPN